MRKKIQIIEVIVKSGRNVIYTGESIVLIEISPKDSTCRKCRKKIPANTKRKRKIKYDVHRCFTNLYHIGCLRTEKKKK